MAEGRAAKQLTQAQVAKELGRPRAFVSEYESGWRQPDVILFVEVCIALEAVPEEVIRALAR